MFLKNKNIIFKIRRSKVTDYAALSTCVWVSSVQRVKCACMAVLGGGGLFNGTRS